MFKDELLGLSEKIKDHGNKPTFWLWSLITIYITYKAGYMYIIFIAYINTSIIILLISRKPSITIIKDKKLSVFIGYIKINLLNGIKTARFEKKIIIFVIINYLFRLIFGVSYKLIRLNISLYDSLYNEYEGSNIKNKKKTIYIMTKYVKKSIEHGSFIEFVKKKPYIEEEITIEIRKIKKKISIYII